MTSFENEKVQSQFLIIYVEKIVSILVHPQSTGFTHCFIEPSDPQINPVPTSTRTSSGYARWMHSKCRVLTPRAVEPVGTLKVETENTWLLTTRGFVDDFLKKFSVG